MANYDEEEFEYEEEDEEIEDDEDEEGSGNFDIDLPYPHEGQQKIIDSKARFKVLLCGRRWGKTLVSQIIAISAMIDGKKVAYVTPEFSLGKDFFREILQRLPKRSVSVNNKSDLFIELISGGSLKFFSGRSFR